MSKIKIKEIIDLYIPCKDTEQKFFTQFNINSNDSLPHNIIKDYAINDSTSTLKILSAKFIKTIEGTSIEGQHLTGTKLSVIGIIYVNTVMSNNEISCKNYYVKNKIPFSTFIIVPNKICNEEKISLGYLIEDITVIKISEKSLFTSVTLLLEYYNTN